MKQGEFDFPDDDGSDDEPPFSDSTTFGKVRKYYDANVDNGLFCPLCKQFAKIYKRKLNKTMIKALRVLYQAGASADFVHSQSILQSNRFGGDVGKLCLFKLVEELEIRRDDGGRAGYWKVTDAGCKFLRGQITVSKYAFVYNGRLLGYEGDQVNINTVAPEFRLDDLMDDQ